jgi:hypothetical protein
LLLSRAAAPESSRWQRARSALHRNGLGGGVYVAAGTVIVAASDISYNQARGGFGDSGGADGNGVGGGVHNLGTFLFDDATVIAHNHASDGYDDCFGCGGTPATAGCSARRGSP